MDKARAGGGGPSRRPEGAVPARHDVRLEGRHARDRVRQVPARPRPRRGWPRCRTSSTRSTGSGQRLPPARRALRRALQAADEAAAGRDHRVPRRLRDGQGARRLAQRGGGDEHRDRPAGTAAASTTTRSSARRRTCARRSRWCLQRPGLVPLVISVTLGSVYFRAMTALSQPESPAAITLGWELANPCRYDDAQLAEHARELREAGRRIVDERQELRSAPTRSNTRAADGDAGSTIRSRARRTRASCTVPKSARSPVESQNSSFVRSTSTRGAALLERLVDAAAQLRGRRQVELALDLEDRHAFHLAHLDREGLGHRGDYPAAPPSVRFPFAAGPARSVRALAASVPANVSAATRHSVANSAEKVGSSA